MGIADSLVLFLLFFSPCMWKPFRGHGSMYSNALSVSQCKCQFVFQQGPSFFLFNLGFWSIGLLDCGLGKILFLPDTKAIQSVVFYHSLTTSLHFPLWSLWLILRPTVGFHRCTCDEEPLKLFHLMDAFFCFVLFTSLLIVDRAMMNHELTSYDGLAGRGRYQSYIR